MAEVSFKGMIIAPDTDIKPLTIAPNSTETFKLSDADIVLHAVYVSHTNPVAVLIQIEPYTTTPDKELKFKGYFGNETRPMKFDPPIGPFKEGKVKITATATGATEDIIVNVQYSKRVEFE